MLLPVGSTRLTNPDSTAKAIERDLLVSLFGRLCPLCLVRTAMREKIRLVSTAGTGYFYTTTKNRRNTPDKLVIKKYDPKVKGYVDFKEAKIK